MKSIIYRVLLSTLLGAFAMVFWMRVHPEWLSFQEQYQMFLFTVEYFQERLCVVGGLADYISEFFVQFFYYTWSGALAMTIQLVGLQLLIWVIARRLCAKGEHYALSFIPSMLVVGYMGDPNAMPTIIMTFIVALIFVCAYCLIPQKREYIQIAFIPLVYWFAGYGVFVYVALTLIFDFVHGGFSKRNVIIAFIHILTLVASIVVAMNTYMLFYTKHNILFGVNNYRQRLTTPDMQHWIAVSLVLVPVVMMMLSRLKHLVVIVAEVLAIVGMGFWTIGQYSSNIYQQLKFVYMVRHQRWNAVLNLAKMEMPETEMSCTAVNLALGMKGQLLDKMFDYYQCGQDGLITRFDRNCVACTITAEACYYLGLINSVLRYNYDLQEAIENRRKSCRFSQRIAEGYIVNHRYDAAEKYLKRLRNTLFYSDWAKEATTYLYDDAKVDSHPVWGKLRKYQFEEEQLNSFSDMDLMLFKLYEQCKENKLALEYGLACTLINGNRQLFENYIQDKR